MTRLPRDRLAALRPEDVQQYLRSRGWLLDSSGVSDKAVVYHYPGQADAEVLVPRQREVTDYAARLGDVVQVLSALEERTVWEVINDVSGPPADVLRLAVSTANAALGSVPLNEGIKLIEGGRSLLLAAACSVHSPQPFYPRQTFREAVEFLDTCRLGQTERGSFVATIVTPVPPAIEQQACLPGMEGSLEAAEPFPRRVTMRLMQGLGHISQSLDTGTPERILAGVPHGVSANMCEALASMKPAGEQSQLRIRMSWSPARPQLPTSLPQTVSFSQGVFALFDEIGRSFRERSFPKLDRIEGYIVQLRAESTLLEGFEGTVVVKADVAGAPTRVRVALNKADYLRACDAHRDGKRVAILGTLRRDTKTYELRQPRELQVH